MACSRLLFGQWWGFLLLTAVVLCGCTTVRLPQASDNTLPQNLLNKPADGASEKSAADAAEPSGKPSIADAVSEDTGGFTAEQVAAVENLLIIFDPSTDGKSADRKTMDAWRQKPADPATMFTLQREPRWVHYGLSRLSKTTNPPPLEAALLSSKQHVAITATIELARNPATRSTPKSTSSADKRSDAESADSNPADPNPADDYSTQLQEIISGTKATLAQKRAAIEALGLQQQATILQSLLQSQHKRLAKPEDDENTASEKLPSREETAELFEETLLALAAMQKATASEIVFALKRPLPAVQYAALAILTHQTEAEFPHEAVPLIIAGRTAKVRIAALAAVAAHNHTPALEAVEQATRGLDLVVRLEAIRTLGKIGNEQAIDALRKIYQQPSKRLAREAIEALGAAGDWNSVRAAASHTARDVRQQAATTLGGDIPQHAAPLLRNLLTDSSIDVRTAAINGARKLPLEYAGPLLLSALESDAARTRLEAFQALARIWPTAADTGVDQFVGEYKVVAPRLRASWQQEQPAVTPAAAAEPGQLVAHQAPADVPANAKPPSPRLLADIKQWLQWSNTASMQGPALGASSPELRSVGTQRLQQLGDRLPSLLQAVVEKEGRPASEVIPANVFSSILPAVDRKFATVEQLGSEIASIRRIAAKELAANAQVAPLPALAIARILHHQRAADPADLQINLVRAAHLQPAGSQLLHNALLSGPDAVKKAACEEIALLGSPQFIEQLTPLLASNEPTLVLAAINAMAKCGPLEDPAPLEQLLRNSQAATGVAAAAALLQLNFDSGAAALILFTIHPEKNVRRRAVVAMGESKDPQFKTALLQRLDDDTSVRETALAALPLVTGADPTTGAVNTTERIAAWKAWAARQ